MTAGTEAYRLVHEIAGGPDRPVKAAINRVVARIAPYLKLSPGRVEDIWYEEARLIRAEEIDALRSAAEAQRQRIEAGRAAARDLAALYHGVAERLRSVDEDFHRHEITRLERQAREICPLDRAGASSVAPAAPRDGGQT